MEKKVDLDALKELEQSKNDVLRRVAEKLKNQVGTEMCAGHFSHSSGAGRTHSSSTSH
jgi:hypothetical protein